VLNDLLTDEERTDASRSFARLTRGGGILVLDVREAVASEERADGIWRIKQVGLPDGCRLRFGSRPTWANGRIVVEERYELTPPSGTSPQVRQYTFEMRPWTAEELVDQLSRVGYRDVVITGGVGRQTSDRLLAVARR
jgi:hypothetical protein